MARAQGHVRKLRRTRAGVAGGLVAAVLVTLGGWVLLSRLPGTGMERPTGPLKITPFTTDGGNKGSPRFAPDGEKVAYYWSGPDDDNYDIYVKALGRGAKPLRLTEDPAGDRSPAWSADGRRIAFVRIWEDEGKGGRDRRGTIYTVPSLGGQERKLIDNVLCTTLSWSADGEWLAFTERPSEDEPSRIARVSLATLQREPLTFPPKGSGGDSFPEFSRDRRFLAFWRQAAGVVASDVWVQPVDGGEARQLTFSPTMSPWWSPSWTTQGEEVAVAKAGSPNG